MASHLKQLSPLKEGTNSRTAKLPTTTTRIMASGPCTYLVILGNLRFRCPCQHGAFKIQQNVPFQGNEDCEECTHPLSVHEDAASSAVTSQKKLLKPLRSVGPLECLREKT